MLKIFLISLDVIIHLSCSLAAFMQKNSQKMFFLIYMTIIRIEKKKAYLSLPVLAACTQVGGVNCLFVLTIQTQIPTEFPIINQIGKKKVLSIQKTHFFNCVLQDTVARKGLNIRPCSRFHIYIVLP